MSNIPSISELYDLDHTIAKALFLRHTYPWEVLKELKAFILALGETLPTDEYDHPEEGVWIAKDAKVFPSAYIDAPCIIDHGAEIPHHNYVGDSVLGWHAHMGAGSITSNVKSDRTNIVIRCGKETAETGAYKIGAMLGDFVEVGCNSVLNPGTIIGKHTNIYPLSRVRGVIMADSIYKSADNIVLKENR